MKNICVAAFTAAIGVVAFTPSSHAQARVVAGGGPASPWAAGSIIGVASVLVTYDLIRRHTCSGDFLNLGGPGFTSRIGPSDNVMPPRRCAPSARAIRVRY